MLSKNQIKELQALHLKKFRDEKQLFIAEGVKTVNEVLANCPDSIQMIYALKEFNQQHEGLILKQKIKWIEVTESELQKISLQNSPNQVLAVCAYLPENEIKFDFKTHFSFYLDEVRDPGNFGTIVRLADWYGITDLFCSINSCDIYNPKVIQSTMGAFLRVKVHYVDLEDLIQQKVILSIYGALLHGEIIYRQKLNTGLILIGNEANGIQEKNLKFITHQLTIPSAGQSQTESLNAAMAASIIASEFYRQLNFS